MTALLVLALVVALGAVLWASWRHAKAQRLARAAVQHVAQSEARTERILNPERKPYCYCGKKARRVTEYAGRRLPVCSAWCAGRLPSKVAALRGRM